MVWGERDQGLSNEYLAIAHNKIRHTDEGREDSFTLSMSPFSQPQESQYPEKYLLLGRKREESTRCCPVSHQQALPWKSQHWDDHMLLTAMPVTQPSARWYHTALGLYGKFSFWHAPLVMNTSITRLCQKPAATVSSITGCVTERIIPGLLAHHSTAFAILNCKLLAENQQPLRFKNAKVSCLPQGFPKQSQL